MPLRERLGDGETSRERLNGVLGTKQAYVRSLGGGDRKRENRPSRGNNRDTCAILPASHPLAPRT